MFQKKVFYQAAVCATLSVIASAALAQQGADAVRGKCIEEAMRAYPETSVGSQNTQARTEIYITCMRNHGLRP